MLPAPVPADQMPEIVRSIDRPLPSVRSRVQQLEEATAATTRDAQDRRPLRPPPGGLGRSSFGQVKVPTPRHGPHMQEVVAPPPPKAPSRKASPAPRPQEIQAHFVDYQDSHEAPSRRMSPAGSSEPLVPQSPPWQAAAPSSQDTNQAPQLPHLLCRPGRMALTELASEEAKPDSPERCRKQESHSGSEADSCRRGRRSAVVCGSDRKVSPGRSDSSVDMAALEAPGSPQGGSSSRGSLQDRINQQLDKELSSHSPSEAGDAEALEAAPQTQVDDLPFALGQKAEDIPSDAAVADFLLQMHEQTGKGQTSRSSSEANDLSAYAAQAEQGLEDGKPEEVHEEIEKEASRRSSEAEEPEQQEAETEEQADDIPLDSAQADQAVEEIKPEEVHEQMERETSRSSSEAEEPEQQEAETEEQADDLRLQSAQADQAVEEIKPEEVHEQIERETSRSSSEAEEPEQQEAETEEQAKADLPLDSAAEQSSEEIKREEAVAEMRESASGSEADEPEQQEREVEKQAQDVPLDTVPAPALEASKAEDPTPAAPVPPASSFSSFKLNACAVAFVPGAMTWTGLNAEAPAEIQQPKDAKQITEETWENYICDQKQKENLAAQATSHTEVWQQLMKKQLTLFPLHLRLNLFLQMLSLNKLWKKDSLKRPNLFLQMLSPNKLWKKESLKRRLHVDEKMDENSIRGISEAGPQVRKIGVLKILESGTLITMVR
ncbi:unnamed protein product [Cladocopium goreaui]|uniref:Uncharacterized protein n=1 Tax=Cladocopium goreaui TaxID=2562237 RepID=A0A9P1G9F2_9DINO|nr:unnamed protein product [Cladocopium goreaui]